MSDNRLNWQQTVRGEREGDAAQELIDGINDLLQDDTAEVLRQIASELTLSLRNLRHIVQKIGYECDTQTQAVVLFKTNDVAGTTLGAFGQELLERIADARQLSDLLAFYALALAEQGKAT